MNKQDILNYLKKQQQFYSDNYGIQFIGIFGSFARDEANENSDLVRDETLKQAMKSCVQRDLSYG